MEGTHLPRSPAWDVDSTAPVALLSVAPSAFLGCFSFLAVVWGRSGFHSWGWREVKPRGVSWQDPPNLLRISLCHPAHSHLELRPVHRHSRATGAAEPPEVLLGIGSPDGLLQFSVDMGVAVQERAIGFPSRSRSRAQAFPPAPAKCFLGSSSGSLSPSGLAVAMRSHPGSCFWGN